ncbi:ras-related protein Rab-37 isoform X3 [Osmerus eperlanus]
MVGNSNVGKTSFLNQFRSGEFCSDICASIGIDTCTQSVIVDGKTVMLQLWDTAGQERFRSITRQVFHKAQAFLLMYDITSSQSFSDVRYWVTSIQDNAIDEVIIILLGNKTDCAKRQVEPHEAESLAKEYNIYFMECSAATGDNVQQSMEIVARLMKQKVDEAEEGSMVLHKEPPVKKSSGCC